MDQQQLAVGATLGGRFEVINLAGKGDLGWIYKAKDTSTGKIIALRVIPSGLIPNEADVDLLRLRVKKASSLTHRNIRATFGMGVEEDGTIFIVAEWIEGQSLRTLLKTRMDAGKRFSFKGAYNIVGHVCNALTYAHKETFHGEISPRAIMINDAGRVKISDWGLSVIRIKLKGYAGRQKVEASFWAPEVLKSAQAADAKSDIYAVGALFYEMITGVSPKRPLKAPSQLGFSKEVDKIVARCMAANPQQRYEHAVDVKNAISVLTKVEQLPIDEQVVGTVDDDLGIDIEIDLGDMSAQETAPNSMESAPSFNAADGLESKEPTGGSAMLDAPGLPAPPSKSLSTVSSGDLGGQVSSIDMSAVLSSIGQSEAAKWMVQKDKFDHGPFADRELIQMIMLGEVLYNHQLLNMDTGVRKKVKAWGDFDEFLERYRLKKKEKEEQAALVRTETAEKRGTAFKSLIALAVIGLIVLGVGGYFLSRQMRAEKKFGKGDLIAALDSGEIKLKIGGDLMSRKKKSKGRRRGKGGGGSGGSSGEFAPGMSYEDAMNQGVSLGSLSNNSGQRQLTAADIESIMSTKVRRFLPCMDGSTKRVDMNIAVGGNGKIIGVSVKQGSAALKKCVASKVRSIKFPASSAPRTATSWYFELY